MSGLDLALLKKYVEPVSVKQEYVGNDEYLGRQIIQLSDIDTIDAVDIALLGVSEVRGSAYFDAHGNNSVAPIREALFSLYAWHTQFTILDLGDIKPTTSLKKTYESLQIIAEECIKKRVLLFILGGSHDLLIPQYHAFQKFEKPIQFCNIDALIDLDKEYRYPERTYLESIFFDTPKMLDAYTHIGFQSYHTNPKLLAILDQLNCSCMRLGFVKDQPYEAEPEIRSANLIAFDIQAISSAFSPVSAFSPNGLSGEEACTLVRFAGMSEQLQIMGIYGYLSSLDKNKFSAQLIAQMFWYFLEGQHFKQKECAGRESPLDNCNTFYIAFNQPDTEFYQNKITKRWWMRIHDNLVIPCSYGDYKKALENELPERWQKYANLGLKH